MVSQVWPQEMLKEKQSLWYSQLLEVGVQQALQGHSGETSEWLGDRSQSKGKV